MKQQSYVSFRIGDKNNRLPYSLLCTKVCLHVKLPHVSLKIFQLGRRSLESIERKGRQDQSFEDLQTAASIFKIEICYLGGRIPSTKAQYLKIEKNYDDFSRERKEKRKEVAFLKLNEKSQKHEETFGPSSQLQQIAKMYRTPTQASFDSAAVTSQSGSKGRCCSLDLAVARWLWWPAGLSYCQ